MSKHTFSVRVGEHELTFETGRIARQANGSVVLRCGDTVVFASACSAPNAQDGDFLPLRVDYIEKFSSAGKTLGGFIKREGKLAEREVLTSRLIDRPLRPMFPEGYFDEVQVLTYVWSYDDNNQPDILAINAASAALSISDIPLVKPIAAVRIGRVSDQWVINPTLAQMKVSKLDLILAGTHEAILMIEGRCEFLTEEQLLEALALGHQSIRTICEAISRLQQEIGKPKDLSTIKPLDQTLLNDLRQRFEKQTKAALMIQGKKERSLALDLVNETINTYCASLETPPTSNNLKRANEEMRSRIMREAILNDRQRLDGRKLDEVRPISIEVGVLPRTHGSCLFTRGETQALAVCTLGSDSMGQRFEDLNDDGLQCFYLHYTFPPFSVGEVGRMGPPGRREVGHGKLAERALLPLIPSKEAFAYAIRLESNITESNGSSSMASVCGGCLAMMDAGIPIERPVAGIAMGLILDKNRYSILTDILGTEDALGDMDFKVAGDRLGVTSFQMDIKVEGITLDIMRAALMQAKSGRLHILDKMMEVCPQAKAQLSPYAPRIVSVKVKQSQIGMIIGPGGKQIRSIIEACGPNVTVDINDEGLVAICGTNAKGVEAAEAMIRNLTAEVEVGKVYEGKVKEILPFGVIVELMPGKDGLCHVSEMDKARVNQPEDLVKVGDSFTVKALEVNEKGQVRLSRKATLMTDEEAAQAYVPRERAPRRDSYERRDGGRDRRDSRERRDYPPRDHGSRDDSRREHAPRDGERREHAPREHAPREHAPREHTPREPREMPGLPVPPILRSQIDSAQ